MMSVNNVLMGLIVGLVLLFIGLYMVSAVSEVGNWSVNVYTDVTNSTLVLANSTEKPHHYFTIGAINDGQETNGTVSITLVNETSGAGTLTATLNGVFLVNITIPATTSTTTVTRQAITESALNNLTYETDVGGLTNVTTATINYASSTSYTTFGSVHASTTTMTGTIFAVLGLVIIVVALGMAIKSIQTVA